MIRGLKALVQSLSLNFVDKKLEGAKINFPGGYLAFGIFGGYYIRSRRGEEQLLSPW